MMSFLAVLLQFVTHDLNGEVMQFPVRHLDPFIGKQRDWINRVPSFGLAPVSGYDDVALSVRRHELFFR